MSADYSYHNNTPQFSTAFTLVVCVGCLLLMFALQIVGVWLSAWLYLAPNTLSVQQLIIQGSQDGMVVAWSIIFTAVVLSMLSLGLMYFRLGGCQQVWRFFDLTKITLKPLLVSMAYLLVFVVVSEALTQYLGETPMDFMDGLLDGQSFYWMIIAITLVAPIYEELLFRGLIFGVLRTRLQSYQHGDIWAMLLSGLMFAAVHLQYNWFGLLMVFMLALLFCVVRMRYGLLMAIVLHIVNNAIAMAAYLWV